MKTSTNCEPKSKLPALNTSLRPPPPPEPSINQFLACLEQGISAWEQAGKILVQLHQNDVNIFAKIITKCDWLTESILWSFYRVGEGKIYPRMLLMGSRPGERRLLHCRMEIQKKYCHEPVAVVTHLEKGAPVVERKFIKELTSPEVERVFVSDHLRTVPEQAALIAPRPPSAPRPATELLPCPFCGSQDIEIISRDDSIHAICNLCQAQGPSSGEKEDASRYWNERRRTR